MAESPLPSCSILLLAGGRGLRMGGRDKGLIEWRNRPLIAWMHSVVRPLTDDLLLSCNRNQEQYAPYADRLISDGQSDYSGPLAGIRTGLAAARHPWLMVLPCDAPLIDAPLLRLLHASAIRDHDHPLMVRRSEQWEPLFCMIPLHLGGQLEAAWQAGDRSPLHVLLTLGARALDLPENDPRLANLNTPELLQR
ncbi:molybdenum cofactor guanylyltransferase MobA [Stutzerimonas stutzeri]|uniref:molybdenum cofactor guanylyltransferase MobA n=1 Tax=Stutzerimonas sp. S1 TaxID=3030652 RepID=UPI0022240078|nr:molybdenum cofactor guanylyltransferase MobA [Stutzerimonas sp. S1]MCW3148790.1 molybdenum cofactor guanylyltransferase MobA [Stutzerimonas sp. S1]